MQVKETGHPGLPLLSVYLDRGVIPYAEGGKRVHAPSERLDAYQVVRPGDLVLNNQQAWRGSVGVSAHSGIISPAYVIWRNLPFISAELAKHLYRAPVMVDQFVTASRGVGDIQRDLHAPSLRNTQVPVPPIDHQLAIAKYLAHANARIDKAITSKRRLIALLQEQRDLLAREVMGLGLEHAPGTTDSGYSWLGSIPGSWTKYRLKDLVRDVDERSADGTEEILSVSHITGVTPRSEKTITMFEAASYVGHKICHPGDIVVNTMWAWMGALGVAPTVGIVSPAYNVYRVLDSNLVEPEFLALLLRSRQYIDLFRMLSTGVRPSRLRFYPDQMLATPVFLPPLDEQRLLIQSVISNMRQGSSAIEKVEREVALLQEFRKRVVADVVTGQVDVRAIAASLPDVSEVVPDLSGDSDEELDEAASV